MVSTAPTQEVSPPILAVVVVSYNVRHFLYQCLRSVYASKSLENIEVWVVDNASVDGSAEMVAEHFPQVRLVASHENLGFAKGNNLALTQSTASYKLLLNPDTVLEEDTLQKCVSYMQANLEVGGLGVRMVDGNGRFLPESKRGLPTPWVSFTKIFGLATLAPKSNLFGRYHLGYLAEYEIAEVDVLSGAFMLLRAEVLDKIGLLDEAFFMYGEDVDLSYRIQIAGYKNVYFPQTTIIHYKGESTKRGSLNYVKVFYQAMAIFSQKHFGGGGGWLLQTMISLAIVFRGVVAVAHRLVWGNYMLVTDACLTWLGIWGLKEYWEVYSKGTPYYYPPLYMEVIVPLYITIWLAVMAANGQYRRPYSLQRILISVGVGTLLISAGSNFIDQIRFSKALILLGSAYAVAVFVFVRVADNLRLFSRLTLAGEAQNAALIVGSAQEAKRIMAILAGAKAPMQVLGWITTGEMEEQDELCVGQIRNLDQIIEVFRADEVIFGGEELEARQIIGYMRELASRKIQFMIAPPDADFVLGSASATSQGELYGLEIKRSSALERGLTAKRLLDCGIVLLIAALLPVIVWFYRDKLGLLKNLVQVLIGRKSWVSIGQLDGAVASAKMRPGVLTPGAMAGMDTSNLNARRRLDTLYAARYAPSHDLELIWRYRRMLDIQV